MREQQQEHRLQCAYYTTTAEPLHDGRGSIKLLIVQQVQHVDAIAAVCNTETVAYQRYYCAGKLI
jgi:hypothetical protein